MDYRPGDTVYAEFVTSAFATGTATTADSLPTATLNKNGSDDGAVTVTVAAALDAGRYSLSFTIPTTYAVGDVLAVSVSATVSTIVGKGVVWGGRVGAGVGGLVNYVFNSVWLDTVNGTTGTTNYVNGIATKPSDTITHATTIAASVGLKRFYMLPESSVTLAQAYRDYVFGGDLWTLALGTQNVDGCTFNNATVSGVATLTAAIAPLFTNCTIGTTTLPACQLYNCALTDTLTLASGGGTFLLTSCWNGGGTATLELGASHSAMTVRLREWYGGLTIKHLLAGDTLSIDGYGTITLDATCTGGTFARHGWINVTDNSTGVTETTNVTPASIVSGVWQDATAGDFTVSGSIGKSLFTSGVVPGGAGGLFISGANTGPMSVSLGVTFSNAGGSGFTCSSGGSNGNGAEFVGNGTGAGLYTHSTSGTGLFLAGAVFGMRVTGGSTGTGIGISGGSVSGVAVAISSSSGDALNLNATGGYDINLAGSGTIHGALTGSVASVTAAVVLPTIPSNWITSAGIAAGAITATTFAATALDAVWDTVLSGHLTTGTTGKALNSASSAGDPWSTALPGAYGAGTAGYIVGTNLNATITSRLALASYTTPPTVAAIATGVWQDATAGDFTASGSIGQSLFTGVAPGAHTGLMLCGANTGPWSVSGGVTFSNSGGDAFACTSSGGNGNGINVTANGTGNGIMATGGGASSATQYHCNGLYVTGGANVGSGMFAAGSPTVGTGISVWGTGVDCGIVVQGGASGFAGMYVVGGGTNGHGFVGSAQGTGNGIYGLGGSTGDGIQGTGGINGNGFHGIGGSTVGHGFRMEAQVAGYSGLYATGTGAGTGATFIGGTTGDGFSIMGGSISGDGLDITTTNGHAVDIVAAGAGKYDVNLAGSGTINGTFTGYTAPSNASIASILAIVNSGTYGNSALLTAISAIPTSNPSAATIAAAVKTVAIDNTYNLQQYLSIVGAAVAGAMASGGPGSITWQRLDGAKTVITGTADTSGDRTAVSYTP